MKDISVQQMADEVASEIEARLGIRGKSLAIQLRKCGRLLPRRIRREATYLAETLTRAENPRLMKQLDLPRCAAAHTACMAHLSRIDGWERRKNRILGMAGSIAFGLLVTIGLVITVLVWRGYV